MPTVYKSPELKFYKGETNKNNQLKQEVLWMMNWLLIPETEDQFRSQKNKDFINILMALNYFELKIRKGNSYTSDLFKPDSKVSKVYNINIGFQWYYLIARLWKNNGLPNSNWVQIRDTETLTHKWSRLYQDFCFWLKSCGNKLGGISLEKYQTFQNNDKIIEATNFFDSHSSRIEIVKEDGELTTRYFEILPHFLPFSQAEKDNFWLSYNLEDVKETSKNLIDFGDHKINELLIQQSVQSWKLCMTETAKTNNWLTTFLIFLVLITNIILFFGLEIDQDDVFEISSLFDPSSSKTDRILSALSFLICTGFLYICILQVIITYKIQSYWALKGVNKKNKTCCKKFWKTLWFMARNYEKTLECRNIWWLLLCVGFSLAGLFIDHFWLAFTMIFIVIFSPDILEMTKAVWKPRKRIMYTLLLSAIIIYWFGVIAYVNFSSDFNEVVKGSNLTLRRILAVIFNSWHNSGLGGFFTENGGSAFYKEVGDDNNKENVYNLKSGRMVYDFMFFFSVPTLLLSILGGIVVEHFFGTRSKSDHIIEAKKSKCFICGKSSIDIPEFKNHCKFTHNIWDYMYYISFIKEVKESHRKDYRDILVYNSLQNKNNFWLPAFQDDARNIANTQKPRDILGEVIPNDLDHARHD